MTLKSRLVRLEKGTRREKCTCGRIVIVEEGKDDAPPDTAPPCAIHRNAIRIIRIVAVRPANAGGEE